MERLSLANELSLVGRAWRPRAGELSNRQPAGQVSDAAALQPRPLGGARRSAVGRARLERGALVEALGRAKVHQPLT